MDWFLLISSLVVGILLGMLYFYTTFEAEYVQNKDLGELNYQQETRFRVIGDEYGGCLRGQNCASFEIASDRSFQYFRDGTTSAPQTGRIPSKLWNELKTELEAANLVQLEKRRDGYCTSYVDGIDFHFTVSLDSTIHNLDTCETWLKNDPVLENTLTFLFDYLQNPESYKEQYELNGVTDWLLETVKTRVTP